MLKYKDQDNIPLVIGTVICLVLLLLLIEFPKLKCCTS